MPDNVADRGGPVPDREQSFGGHHNRRNGRRNQAARESTFKGRCDELKEAVYDVTTGKETFLKTIRKSLNMSATPTKMPESSALG